MLCFPVVGARAAPSADVLGLPWTTRSWIARCAKRKHAKPQLPPSSSSKTLQSPPPPRLQPLVLMIQSILLRYNRVASSSGSSTSTVAARCGTTNSSCLNKR